MNKRSIKRGLVRSALALVAFTQSLAYAQTSETPGAAPSPEPAKAAPSGGRVITIASEMRYARDTFVDPAVINECKLPQQGAELLEAAAKAAGVEVLRVDDAKSAKGRVFVVEITQVMSTGNAFTGHRKQVGVVGRLMDGDKELGVFRGARNSMGGAFAGFKGSCSVLGRCLEALSKDMAVWLKAQPR